MCYLQMGRFPFIDVKSPEENQVLKSGIAQALNVDPYWATTSPHWHLWYSYKHNHFEFAQKMILFRYTTCVYIYIILDYILLKKHILFAIYQIMFYITLCYILLYSIISWNIILYDVMLLCFIIHYITSNYIMLYYVILY